MTHEQIFNQYIANIFDYIKNTGWPDEVFMRKIESKIDVVPQKVDDFRRNIVVHLAIKGVTPKWENNELILVNQFDQINWKFNPELKKAIELYKLEN